jgi:hypothetical protein
VKSHADDGDGAVACVLKHQTPSQAGQGRVFLCHTQCRLPANWQLEQVAEKVAPFSVPGDHENDRAVHLRAIRHGRGRECGLRWVGRVFSSRAGREWKRSARVRVDGNMEIKSAPMIIATLAVVFSPMSDWESRFAIMASTFGRRRCRMRVPRSATLASGLVTFFRSVLVRVLFFAFLLNEESGDAFAGFDGGEIADDVADEAVILGGAGCEAVDQLAGGLQVEDGLGEGGGGEGGAIARRARRPDKRGMRLMAARSSFSERSGCRVRVRVGGSRAAGWHGRFAEGRVGERAAFEGAWC